MVDHGRDSVEQPAQNQRLSSTRLTGAEHKRRSAASRETSCNVLCVELGFDLDLALNFQLSNF